MTLPDPHSPDIDQLWDYNQPAESEKRFRQALASPALPPDPSLSAELLTQIARAQGIQRQFDAAHHTLDQVEGMLSSISQRARTRLLLERGRVYNSSGQPERAYLLFLQSWDLARESGEDFYAVDAAHMLAIVAPAIVAPAIVAPAIVAPAIVAPAIVAPAIVAPAIVAPAIGATVTTEPPEDQLGWNLKAIELAETSAQPRARKWLGSLYNNLGWTYHSQGEYGRALEFFTKALQWQKEHGRPPDVRIARWCTARALRSLQRYPEALALQRSLLKEMEQTGVVDGYVFEEVAENLLQMGQPDAARPFFSRAFRELSTDPWLAAGEPGRLERLRELGRVSK